MRRIWSRVRGEAAQRGQALILVVMFMTALLGFASLVIDFSQMALDRRRIQNAVDAGALAGVQVLPKKPDLAVSAATQWALKNGATGSEVAAPLVTKTNIKDDTITVTAARDVPFTFGRVLGINSREVTTTATAIVGSVVGGTGIMPFAIEDENGELPGIGRLFGEEIAIKEADHDDMGPGNYGFVALDDKGGDNMREVIENGGSRTLYKVNDKIPTEPGQKVGPLRQGLEEWADRHNDDIYSSDCNDWDASHEYISGKLVIDKQCQYRVILIPIIDAWPNGRKDVTILGFAQMYLHGFDEDSKEKRLDAIFLDDTINHPDIIFGPVNDWGTRVVKLSK